MRRAEAVWGKITLLQACRGEVVELLKKVRLLCSPGCRY